MINYMMIMLLALAYPMYCMIVCMWFFFLAMIINLIEGSRWARFGVSKEVKILLHSPRGLVYISA